MNEESAYGWSAPPPEGAQGWQQVPAPAPPRAVSLSTGGAVAACMALLVAGAPLWSLQIGADGDVAAFDLAPGDCATGLLDVAALPATPQRVSCDEPHEVEVYAVAEPLPAGRYPDEVALDTHASGWCEIAFESYIGIDFLSSELDAWPLMPAADAWQGGERRIACLASTLDGSLLEGSVAGPPAERTSRRGRG